MDYSNPNTTDALYRLFFPYDNREIHDLADAKKKILKDLRKMDRSDKSILVIMIRSLNGTLTETESVGDLKTILQNYLTVYDDILYRRYGDIEFDRSQLPKVHDSGPQLPKVHDSGPRLPKVGFSLSK